MLLLCYEMFMKLRFFCHNLLSFKFLQQQINRQTRHYMLSTPPPQILRKNKDEIQSKVFVKGKTNSQKNFFQILKFVIFLKKSSKN